MSLEQQPQRGAQHRSNAGHSLDALVHDYLEAEQDSQAWPGEGSAKSQGSSAATDLDSLTVDINRMREILLPAQGADGERRLELVQKIKRSTMHAPPAGMLLTFRRSWRESRVVRAASVLLLIQLGALPVLGLLTLRNDVQHETVLSFEGPPVDPFASELEPGAEGLPAPLVDATELFALAPKGWPSILDIENQRRVERYRLTTRFGESSSRALPELRTAASPLELVLHARAAALSKQNWSAPKNLPVDVFGYPTGVGLGGQTGPRGNSPGLASGDSAEIDPRSGAGASAFSGTEFVSALESASASERTLVLIQRIETQLDQLALKGGAHGNLRALVMELKPTEEGDLGHLQRATLKRCILAGAIEPELALRIAPKQELELWLERPVEALLGDAWLGNLSAAAGALAPIGEAPQEAQQQAQHDFIAQWIAWARRP